MRALSQKLSSSIHTHLHMQLAQTYTNNDNNLRKLSASRMAQMVKEFITRPDNLSLTPGTGERGRKEQTHPS